MDSLIVLGDSTRRQIVEKLARGAMSSGEIAAQFELTAPAISQHLKILRRARLVRVRAEAQRRIYTLDQQGVDELANWVWKLQHFWADKFDALETVLRK